MTNKEAGMNREQAIYIIRKEYLCVDRDCDIEKNCGKCDLMMPSKEPILEAYKMAMNALAEPKQGETVSLEAYKQVLWERNIAEKQLHELGYELGEKIEPKQEWISVEDMLPEEKQSVLVWCPQYKNIYCAYLEKEQWWIFGAFVQIVPNEVIAWMPIPPYKGDKENNALQRD